MVVAARPDPVAVAVPAHVGRHHVQPGVASAASTIGCQPQAVVEKAMDEHDRVVAIAPLEEVITEAGRQLKLARRRHLSISYQVWRRRARRPSESCSWPGRRAQGLRHGRAAALGAVLRTQVMLSLSGIVVTVTGFSGRAIAETSSLARSSIAAGILVVLASAAVAIWGVLRLSWLTQTIERRCHRHAHARHRDPRRQGALPLGRARALHLRLRALLLRHRAAPARPRSRASADGAATDAPRVPPHAVARRPRARCSPRR